MITKRSIIKKLVLACTLKLVFVGGGWVVGVICDFVVVVVVVVLRFIFCAMSVLKLPTRRGILSQISNPIIFRILTAVTSTRVVLLYLVLVTSTFKLQYRRYISKLASSSNNTAQSYKLLN